MIRNSALLKSLQLVHFLLQVYNNYVLERKRRASLNYNSGVLEWGGGGLVVGVQYQPLHCIDRLWWQSYLLGISEGGLSSYHKTYILKDFPQIIQR